MNEFDGTYPVPTGERIADLTSRSVGANMNEDIYFAPPFPSNYTPTQQPDPAELDAPNPFRVKS
jgi:hypothetical protein